MDSAVEFDGIWWLPNNPQRRSAGKVKYSPAEGTTLDLIGAFEDLTPFVQPTDFLPAIHGLLPDGKRISLLQCLLANHTFHVPGYPESIYRAHLMVTGWHFASEEALTLKEVRAYYTHLSEWAYHRSGFDIDIRDMKKVSVEYTLPDGTEAVLSDGRKVLLDFEADRPGMKVPQEEAVIRQRPRIRVVDEKDATWNTFRDTLYHLQNMLTFLIGHPVQLTKLTGTSLAATRKLASGKEIPEQLELYFPALRSPLTERRLVPDDLLLSFGAIESRFSQIVNLWLDKAEVLAPVYDLFFGTLYAPDMYMQVRFLLLAQALETYHRRAVGGMDLEEPEHQKRLETILSKTPDEHRSWLQEKLAFSNERSLRRRVKELYDRHRDALVDFAPKKTFVNSFVSTRNYLTHYNPSTEGQAASGEDLHTLSEQTRTLLECCLLSELDIPPADLTSMVQRVISRRYQRNA